MSAANEIEGLVELFASVTLVPDAKLRRQHVIREAIRIFKIDATPWALIFHYALLILLVALFAGLVLSVLLLLDHERQFRQRMTTRL